MPSSTINGKFILSKLTRNKVYAKALVERTTAGVALDLIIQEWLEASDTEEAFEHITDSPLEAIEQNLIVIEQLTNAVITKLKRESL